MNKVSYCGESFLTAHEVEAPDTADVVAELRDRTRRQTTPLEREYSDACAAMEYGWDDVYSPLIYAL